MTEPLRWRKQPKQGVGSPGGAQASVAAPARAVAEKASAAADDDGKSKGGASASGAVPWSVLPEGLSGLFATDDGSVVLSWRSQEAQGPECCCNDADWCCLGLVGLVNHLSKRWIPTGAEYLVMGSGTRGDSLVSATYSKVHRSSWPWACGWGTYERALDLDSAQISDDLSTLEFRVSDAGGRHQRLFEVPLQQCMSMEKWDEGSSEKKITIGEDVSAEEFRNDATMRLGRTVIRTFRELQADAPVSHLLRPLSAANNPVADGAFGWRPLDGSGWTEVRARKQGLGDNQQSVTLHADGTADEAMDECLGVCCGICLGATVVCLPCACEACFEPQLLRKQRTYMLSAANDGTGIELEVAEAPLLGICSCWRTEGPFGPQARGGLRVTGVEVVSVNGKERGVIIETAQHASFHVEGPRAVKALEAINVLMRQCGWKTNRAPEDVDAEHVMVGDGAVVVLELPQYWAHKLDPLSRFDEKIRVDTETQYFFEKLLRVTKIEPPPLPPEPELNDTLEAAEMAVAHDAAMEAMNSDGADGAEAVAVADEEGAGIDRPEDEEEAEGSISQEEDEAAAKTPKGKKVGKKGKQGKKGKKAAVEDEDASDGEPPSFAVASPKKKGKAKAKAKGKGKKAAAKAAAEAAEDEEDEDPQSPATRRTDSDGEGIDDDEAEVLAEAPEGDGDEDGEQGSVAAGEEGARVALGDSLGAFDMPEAPKEDVLAEPEEAPAKPLRLPGTFRVRQVIRVEDSEMWRRYDARRKEIRETRQKAGVDRFEESILTDEVTFARPELFAPLERDLNEVYVWHGTSVRNALSIAHDDFHEQDIGSGNRLFKNGLRLVESSIRADELARDEPGGYYDGVYALVLCRVCMGKMYVTDNPWQIAAGDEQLNELEAARQEQLRIEEEQRVAAEAEAAARAEEEAKAEAEAAKQAAETEFDSEEDEEAPENVKMLMGMGFSRVASLHALAANDEDVAAAVTWLSDDRNAESIKLAEEQAAEDKQARRAKRKAAVEGGEEEAAKDPPDESDPVFLLQATGVSEVAAKLALEKNDHDLAAAAQWLLDPGNAEDIEAEEEKAKEEAKKKAREEAIKQRVDVLVAHGFSEASAMHGLRRCRGDVQLTARFLSDPRNADEIKAAEYQAEVEKAKKAKQEAIKKRVEAITQQGFSEAAAMHGLRRCQGDVDAALAWLLDDRNDEEIRAVEQQAEQQKQAEEAARADPVKALTDAGFSEVAAKYGLQKCKNDLHHAARWLMDQRNWDEIRAVEYQEQKRIAIQQRVECLTKMGFSEAGAMQGLRRCRGDVEAAARWLADPRNAPEIQAVEQQAAQEKAKKDAEEAARKDPRTFLLNAGYSEVAVDYALRRSKNDLDKASRWITDERNADIIKKVEAEAEEQRRLAEERRIQEEKDAEAEAMEALRNLGFSEAAASHAYLKCDRNLELTIAWLTDDGNVAEIADIEEKERKAQAKKKPKKKAKAKAKRKSKKAKKKGDDDEEEPEEHEAEEGEDEHDGEADEPEEEEEDPLVVAARLAAEEKARLELKEELQRRFFDSTLIVQELPGATPREVPEELSPEEPSFCRPEGEEGAEAGGQHEDGEAAAPLADPSEGQPRAGSAGGSSDGGSISVGSSSAAGGARPAATGGAARDDDTESSEGSISLGDESSEGDGEVRRRQVTASDGASEDSVPQAAQGRRARPMDDNDSEDTESVGGSSNARGPRGHQEAPNRRVRGAMLDDDDSDVSSEGSGTAGRSNLNTRSTQRSSMIPPDVSQVRVNRSGTLSEEETEDSDDDMSDSLPLPMDDAPPPKRTQSKSSRGSRRSRSHSSRGSKAAASENLDALEEEALAAVAEGDEDAESGMFEASPRGEGGEEEEPVKDEPVELEEEEEPPVPEEPEDRVEYELSEPSVALSAESEGPAGKARQLHELVAYSVDQVYPEYIVIYERVPEDAEDATRQRKEPFLLETPLYWRNCHRNLAHDYYTNQIVVRQETLNLLQKLVDRTCDGKLPTVVGVRRVEHSKMWANYMSYKADLRKRLADSGKKRFRPAKYVDDFFGEVRTDRLLPELAEEEQTESFSLSHLDRCLNEHVLWHGTTKHAAESVIDTQFRIGKSQEPVSPYKFGHGAYFSEQLRKSLDYSPVGADGHCFVLLCRVTCGDYYFTEEVADVDAEWSCKDHGKDSVLANPRKQGPREIIVHRVEAVYPEFCLQLECPVEPPPLHDADDTGDVDAQMLLGAARDVGAEDEPSEHLPGVPVHPEGADMEAGSGVARSRSLARSGSGAASGADAAGGAEEVSFCVDGAAEEKPPEEDFDEERPLIDRRIEDSDEEDEAQEAFQRYLAA